jgi:hypothetical protein
MARTPFVANVRDDARVSGYRLIALRQVALRQKLSLHHLIVGKVPSDPLTPSRGPMTLHSAFAPLLSIVRAPRLSDFE